MDERFKLCRKLGFRDAAHAHEIILEGAHKIPEWLISKGLNAASLANLGYDGDAMRHLGYKDTALQKLGFRIAKEVHKSAPAAPSSALPPEHAPVEGGITATLKDLIQRGCHAGELKQRGITIPHCRAAGIDARVLARLGYALHELAGVYSLAELKKTGFNPRELSRHFKGSELRDAGFSAAEMRCAGFCVRDLINFGFNENQIIGAGFSVNELLREGLSRSTRDLRKLQY